MSSSKPTARKAAAPQKQQPSAAVQQQAEEQYDDGEDLEDLEQLEEEQLEEMFSARPEEILDQTLGNYFLYQQETEDGHGSSLNIADILLLIKQSIDNQTATMQTLLEKLAEHKC